MEVPERVSDPWLAEAVPRLTDSEWVTLVATLRRRGWSEYEIGARAEVWRTRGEATIVEPPVQDGRTPVDDDAARIVGAETKVELSPLPAGPLQTSALSTGQTFAGYVIESVAGRGGMGVVYRAVQLRPRRTVALKVITAELANDPAFRERFERESEIAASIEHSNVIPVYGVGDVNGVLYIAMRFVEGTDMAAAIAAEGRLEPQRAAKMIGQVCSALDAAHARGLVHRDVKPANVLLAREGGLEHVYLTDFGLAKRLTAGSETQTGMFVGTFDYSAPEQFEGGPLDARTDVYATGCLLYQMVTGRVPFPADTEAAKMRAHLNDEPPSVMLTDSRLPAALDDVIARAMAKDPDQRFLSAGDLARAAAAAVGGRQLTRSERSVATGDAAAGAGASSATPDGRRSLPGWLKITAPVVAVGAVAGIAVALATSGGRSPAPTVTVPKPAVTPSPQQLIAKCMSAHGLTQPSVIRKPQPGESQITNPGVQFAVFDQRSFASCTSGPGANPDGYRAISVTEVNGPGSSEASGTDLADRIESTCKTLRLTYSFGSQGVFSRIPPVNINTTEIWRYNAVSGTRSEFSPVSSTNIQLPFFPLANEADVLHNGRVRLDQATCVA